MRVTLDHKETLSLTCDELPFVKGTNHIVQVHIPPVYVIVVNDRFYQAHHFQNRMESNNLWHPRKVNCQGLDYHFFISILLINGLYWSFMFFYNLRDLNLNYWKTRFVRFWVSVVIAFSFKPTTWGLSICLCWIEADCYYSSNQL